MERARNSRVKTADVSALGVTFNSCVRSRLRLSGVEVEREGVGVPAELGSGDIRQQTLTPH
jgi:hypothetical protein